MARTRKYSNTSERVYIFTETGKRAGYVEAGTFYRLIDDDQILYKPAALAQGVYALDQLVRLGVERLEFRHKRTGEVYRTSLSHFLEKSFELDRGYGVQRALPLTGWIVERPVRAVEPKPDAPGKPASKSEHARQLGLWGGR